MPLIEGTLLAGRYRLKYTLGQGGMSTVYAAEDLRLGREVAIKLIRETQTSQLSERLFREAQAAARANHPGVVTVFAHGTDDDTGRDYLVMEKLEGEDLKTRLARLQHLPSQQVLTLARDVADALAAVHATGVLHRDLKPGNIYLARRGLRVDEVKLLDFGLAKHLDWQTLTEPGQLVGTIAYMAPEQLIASGKVSARSDVYGLGVVMFECLSGRLPHTASSVPGLAAAITGQDAPPLARVRLDVPAGMCEVVDRCLAREPSRRFASARALCAALLALG